MKIRLIALDLDDTLLNSAHQIPPANARAVQQALAAGIHVVLASARPPRSMRRFHEELALKTPLVTYSGAMIYDLACQRALQHTPVPLETARMAVRCLRAVRPDLNLSIECEDRWHLDRYDDDLKRTVEEYGLEPPHGIGTVDQILATGSAPITKILFADDGLEPEFLADLAGRLGPRACLLRTSPYFLEVTAAGVSKATGVAWVAQSLGISPAETLAIGDSENDIPLLQWAGVGVAMGNASESVRQAADAVTLTQDEEGVAAAIEKHALGQP